MSQPIIWKPTQSLVDEANVTRLMKKANVSSYEALQAWSVEDLPRFWNAVMEDLQIKWYQQYKNVLNTSEGIEWSKWFEGGKTNLVLNCIDQHLPVHADEIAIRWENENGSKRNYTYQAFNDEVCVCANMLKSCGVKKGDAVALYMPMIPEVMFALFACFKLGALAVPVFSAFGADALSVRLNDANVKVLITADGGRRRGKVFPLKTSVNQALQQSPSVEKVIVVKHAGNDVFMDASRDVWWQDFKISASTECKTEELDAEAPCLILYTSGTTGKPKGCVHTHAGCLATIGKELAYAFDVKAGDTFFWFTDIGWMMGPWEMIGTTLFRASVLLYEGAPDFPHAGRVWQLLEEHKVRTLGISPTAIRLLMREKEYGPQNYNLSGLELFGSTGELWDAESYTWLFEQVGKKRCPIINISGGTEIIGCLLSPLPITPLKTCSLRGPGLGVDLDIVDDDGNSLGTNAVGHLVCKQPLPSMTKGFLGDKQRYLDTYFSKFPGVWYHGDYVSRDEEGFWFLHGRSDDTLKVAGKRTGPGEIEAALLEHPLLLEAAAIGVPHEIKGEAVVCFVVPKSDDGEAEKRTGEFSEAVVKALGKTLRPEAVIVVSELPKTRSGKIVRGLLRRVYMGEELGSLASVENPGSLDLMAKKIKST
ncbi:MAG: AMP-dependent synthetase [Deltaproteobacteria bacterium CG_4_10_14_0_2_um_filter_43_8]|nr:MAG: AMP-dependent synthetase [Deltaproteobacteria bacterium CG11_big_fil_rev_8_21_14_0_20_42_23]PJA20369.1 MAG: AMP-dependent synthetase [Deltaproteobacteria bacterium CG_4_10_14_0_2_um_filter_43_8]PJC64155.1 MAG: AMP-dependent synthetase [Deltaproteobacteria bacterium CG_4_9_14_0_2_um_filter_42_21]